MEVGDTGFSAEECKVLQVFAVMKKSEVYWMVNTTHHLRNFYFISDRIIYHYHRFLNVYRPFLVYETKQKQGNLVINS